MSLKLGPIFTVILVVLAIAGVSVAFIANASPYVTVSEARKSGATNVHLKGKLVKASIHNDLTQRKIRFQIEDASGETMNVVYSGAPPQDMSQATEIVAIGSVKGSEFHSDKLLIKCPSKYEGKEKATT